MDEVVRVLKKYRPSSKEDKGVIFQMLDEGEDDDELEDPPFEATLITSEPVEIWLGSVSDAMYPRALLEHGITGGIINMASGQCRDIQRMELGNESQSQWDRVSFNVDWYRQHLNRPDMEYLGVPAEDHPRYKISQDFPDCFEFIERVARKKNSGGILVHCIQGLNRSAAVVVAWLVGEKKLSLVEAVELVASKRPGVLTNRGFLKQLLSFEESLKQDHLPELEQTERRIFTVGNIVEKI